MDVSLILSAGADVCGASHICLDGLGFSPLGETGEGFGVWDLTLIGVIDRHVRLPLSQGRGYGLDFFSA